MNFSLRIWVAAAAVLLVSLSLKLGASAKPTDQAVAAARLTVLQRFLAGAADGPVVAIAGDESPASVSGWRFQAGACRAALFPSGARGSLDLTAKNHAARGDLISYVYRGQVRRSPPTWELARDVALYKLAGPWAAGGEPGYVVLTYAPDCGGPPKLPWRRLPPI